MDRQFLEDQDIPARYLSGELTIREAREFEKYCLANPSIVETLPIPIRLKARLARRRLTEEEESALTTPASSAASAPEPPAPVDDPPLVLDATPRLMLRLDRPIVLYALAGALLVALLALAGIAMHGNDLAERLRDLEREARALSLRAPSSLATHRLRPNRTAGAGDAQLTLRWPDPPQLLELRIDVAEGRYSAFALTLDKVDEARVLQLRRVAPDSNRELRLALNSSAFGPGEYLLQIQGYTWRGELVDYGAIRMQLLK